MELELTARERELIVSALENYLSDLRMEIANTDSQDFRETLKERKAALRKLVNALEEEGSPVSPS